MKIKIINGIYGHKINGAIEAICTGDPPIEMDDDRAKRLIEKGIAEQVHIHEARTGDVATTYETNVSDGDDGVPYIDDIAEDGEDDCLPEYSVEMTASELRAIMDAFGLSVKSSLTKAQMVEQLDIFFADDGEAPDPAIENPVT